MKAAKVASTTKRLAAGLALAAVCGVILASSSLGATRSHSGLTTVTYGRIPFAGDAVVALAERKGYFKAVGLDVKIENAAAINTIVPGVVAGTYDFGLQSGGGVAAAVSHNIPVAIIANNYFHNHEQELMVKTGGSIKSLKDLKGQTVALGSLNNNYQAGLFSLLKKAGVDPSSVKFESMDTSQIATAIEKGQVAAGQINEPFITAAGNALTTLADPLEVFGAHAANAYVIVNPHWADGHKDIVTKFLQAYNKAQRLAATDRKDVDATVASYTTIDPKVIAKMNLPGFGPSLGEKSLQQQMTFMYKYHFLAKALTLKQVIYQGLNVAAMAAAK